MTNDERGSHVINNKGASDRKPIAKATPLMMCSIFFRSTVQMTSDEKKTNTNLKNQKRESVPARFSSGVK